MASVCCDSLSTVKIFLISLVFLFWISQGSSKPHRRTHSPDDFSNSFGDDVVSFFLNVLPSLFLALCSLKINNFHSLII